MISDINLEDKTNSQSSKLSGGMKRKLRYVTWLLLHDEETKIKKLMVVRKCSSISYSPTDIDVE